MDKNMGRRYDYIYLIGFPKCGSTSMRGYLRKRFHPNELFSFNSFSLYNPSFNKNFQGAHVNRPKTLYIAIIRDPYQRTWSAYWWGMHRWRTESDPPIPTFKEFLRQRSDEWRYQTSGLDDPILACDYNRYLGKARDLGIDVMVVRFEDMIKNPNFPHEAETKDVILKETKRYLDVPPLDDENRALIKAELEKEGIEY